MLSRPLIVHADDASESSVGVHEQIIDAWTKREQDVASAHFEWTEVRRSNKEVFMPGESRVEPNVPQYSVQSSLSLKDGQIRHNFRKSIWPEEAPQGKNEFVSVANGATTRIYFPPGFLANYPTGYESHALGFDDLESVYLKPFLWSFRTMVPKVLDAPIKNYEMLPEKAICQDRECLVLRRRLSNKDYSDFWVDPARDYLILRNLFTQEGRVRTQIDIQYKQDEKTLLWIPDEWDYSKLNNTGEPALSMKGTLTKYSINPQLPDSRFVFEFPPGTWVHAGESHQHLVLDNGQRRMIAAGDWNLPYETLLADTNPQNGSNRKNWKSVWIKINITMFLSAAVGLIVHRLRSRSPR